MVVPTLLAGAEKALAGVGAAINAPAAAAAGSGSSGTSDSGSTPGDAIGIIQSVLDEFGLGTATANDGTSLAQWAWNQVTASGLDPTTADPTAVSDDVLTQLYNTDAFKQRFPGITAQIAAGQPPITPANYLQLEDTDAVIEKQYNLPPGTLTSSTSLTNQIMNQKSPSEVQADFDNYFAAIENGPQTVRQSFQQFYGPSSDAQLATYIGGGTISDPDLAKEVGAAEIQGAGTGLGLNIGQDRATQLAAMGKTYSDTLDALKSTTAEAGLFTQTASEQASAANGGPGALDINEQGVNATFGLDATSANQIKNEQEERAASFQGGGGASPGAQGAGLGAAHQF